MKDYYDLFKLIEHDLNDKKLKKNIKDVFANRETPLPKQIQFDPAELSQLQIYWEHFLKREKMSGAPERIGEIIDKLNTYLEKLFG